MTTIKNTLKSLALAGILATALAGLTGCDEGIDTSNPYMTDAMLSVNDYQQSTYDYTNSLWSDYIRG